MLRLAYLFRPAFEGFAMFLAALTNSESRLLELADPRKQIESGVPPSERQDMRSLNHLLASHLQLNVVPNGHAVLECKYAHGRVGYFIDAAHVAGG